MISYSAYKIIHLLGLMMVFLSLGGVIMRGINRENPLHSWKKGIAITHGIGMVLLLIAGFGLLARLGIAGNIPGWAWLKFVIWLVLGGMLVIPRKLPEMAKSMWWVALLLGSIAAWLALEKPF